MKAALAGAAPLRRLHAQATAAKDPTDLAVPASEVTAAIEDWALPVARALTEHPSPRFADVRDAYGRSALHLAALEGWASAA